MYGGGGGTEGSIGVFVGCLMAQIRQEGKKEQPSWRENSVDKSIVGNALFSISERVTSCAS